MIHTIRGVRVMLDRDLAQIYRAIGRARGSYRASLARGDANSESARGTGIATAPNWLSPVLNQAPSRCASSPSRSGSDAAACGQLRLQTMELRDQRPTFAKATACQA